MVLDLALDDGAVVDAILARPQGEGPWPGVLVWMDAFGLRYNDGGADRYLLA